MLNYYQFAIWFPIILPAVLLAGVRAFGMPVWVPLGGLVGILVLSLLTGGVPYAALAAWATWKARKLDEAAMRRLAWRAPLLMLIPFTLYAVAMSALDGQFWPSLGAYALAAMYILPIGYLYVIVVLVLGQFLSKRRKLSSSVARTV